jgi:hypothetical protein
VHLSVRVSACVGVRTRREEPGGGEGKRDPASGVVDKGAVAEEETNTFSVSLGRCLYQRGPP